MSNPTTPFSWQMPTNTDLVTDLPADFEVFGQAVATSMADLLGGTTGQVLKKNTNADMDFVWSADAAGMTNPMTTTGDIIYSDPNSTPVRRAIGSTGNVLTVSGGVPVWAAPAGGGKVLQVVQGTTTTNTSSSSSAYADTGLTATITPTLNTSKVLVLVAQNGLRKNSGNTGNGVNLKLFRGATEIAVTYNAGYNGASEQVVIGSGTIIKLDSPATTSATTYKTQFANDSSVASINVQANSDLSSITLLEIGA